MGLGLRRGPPDRSEGVDGFLIPTFCKFGKKCSSVPYVHIFSGTTASYAYQCCGVRSHHIQRLDKVLLGEVWHLGHYLPVLVGWRYARQIALGYYRRNPTRLLLFYNHGRPLVFLGPVLHGSSLVGSPRGRFGELRPPQRV